MPPITVHLLPGHPDLRPLIAALGTGFVVAPAPGKGALGHGVALVSALGLDSRQARQRVDDAARRCGLPALGVVDCPLTGDAAPMGSLVSLAGLTPAALGRALRLMRSRADAAAGDELAVGVVVEAALRALDHQLAGSLAAVADLRRTALADPRAARHVEGLAWSLRAVDRAIAATIEDGAAGQPIPVHTLPSLAAPLLEAALGSNTRLTIDTDHAPLGLVPPSAVALLAHAVCDLRQAPSGQEGPRRIAIRVTAVPGRQDRARVAILHEAPGEESTPCHPATRASVSGCGGELAACDGGLVLELPLTRPDGAHDPTVLVVDDHQEVAAVVSDVLQAQDLQVAVVGTAEQALDHLAHHPGTRLVVSDVALPGIDGVELAARLAEAGCPARVLLITGFDSERPRAAVRSGLVAGVVSKPFSPVELLDAATRALA